MEDPSLQTFTNNMRSAPEGSENARAMVLIAEPTGDGTSLLAPDQDRLVTSMLRAMGLSRKDAYLASALPAPASMPDWGMFAQDGLDAITRHHIALAKPERLLVFGKPLAALLDIDAQAVRAPATLDLADRQVPLLIAPDLAQLVRSPERRRTFWSRWLDWTA